MRLLEIPADEAGEKLILAPGVVVSERDIVEHDHSREEAERIARLLAP